jgi:hypothetical protein
MSGTGQAGSPQRRAAEQQHPEGQQHNPRGEHPGAPAEHDSHGQSVAAWTAVGVMILGFLIMSFAVVFGTVWLFVVGAVVVVLGAVSGKVLSAMGFGASGTPGS